jgi:subtilisin family serine protease
MRIVFSFIFLLFICGAITANAQQKMVYKFAVFFNNKDTVTYPISNPELYLSVKSIVRKQQQNIDIDILDVPVNSMHIKALMKAGFNVHNTSRWFNCAIVFSDNKHAADSLKKIVGVKQVIDVGFSPKKTVTQNNKAVDLGEMVTLLEQKYSNVNAKNKQDSNIYGSGFAQARMINATGLHQINLNGSGVTIALIDAGYRNANKHVVFKHSLKQVITTYDFVDMETNVFDNDDHGTAVWSCLAANDTFNFIGTAPSAKYVLLRSEDATTEFPVEEFYWAIAAEYADSIGADIISSSLGYNEFDHDKYNYEQKHLDGKTAWITQAASCASKKGLLVINSSGNEGDNDWKKIAFPADASEVITVGAVDNKKRLADFSSIGLTSDGRIKPDLMALGENVTIASEMGTIYEGDGTSYSCPILAGGIACLWPIIKNNNATQIIKWLHLSGSYYYKPNKYFGYGVPNLYLVYQFTINYPKDTLLDISVLDDKNYHLTFYANHEEKLKIILVNALGKQVFSQTENIKQPGFVRFKLQGVKKLKRGVYTLHILNDDKKIAQHLIVK